MNKKLYIAPEIAEVVIPCKVMLNVTSENANEVLSRIDDSFFESEEDDSFFEFEESSDGNVW